MSGNQGEASDNAVICISCFKNSIEIFLLCRSLKMIKIGYKSLANRIFHYYLMCNKGPLNTLNGFLKPFILESTFSFSSALEIGSVRFI